jgi:glycerophosphoryl diester phosphodiesterase
MGFRAVEFDVMLSGDGTPVLIHDETLERTTNGCGRVCETPDACLFALDAGGGEQIPSFADAAQLCRDLGLLANVEIKPAAGHEARTAEVVALMAARAWHGDERRLLLSSFSEEALAVARKVAPGLRRGYLCEAAPGDWPELMARLGAQTLHCDALLLESAVLVEAQAKGIPVLCYTVDDPDTAKSLFARGVSALFTDRLDRFAAEATS